MVVISYTCDSLSLNCTVLAVVSYFQLDHRCHWMYIFGTETWAILLLLFCNPICYACCVWSLHRNKLSEV